MPVQPSNSHVLQNDFYINYTLDAWGNMTNRGPSQSGYTNDPVPDNFSNSANTANQLVSQVGYDAAGNMTTVFNGITNISPVFDAENRLDHTNTMGYQYSADGVRTRKLSPDETAVVKDYWFGL